MASPSTDVFDAYFRMADVDKDGRISGAEAVVFLQRSNLPKHVLAQVFQCFADQNLFFLFLNCCLGVLGIL